jgi:cell division protein FtsZ
MITYSKTAKEILPTSSVKIIGLGGAGANMLERIALDGMEGCELLALNTDLRTLGSCIAQEKIQLGTNLTKGLGTGGDPELGHQAMLEAEEELRASIEGKRIVFLCAGLGGGTGSGAAPLITRIAREEGAFVVVFATMPFAFEGRRRREQAESSLNELAVLANALVTFDNNRMGELVLAKQGVHEAFTAADQMICESIKAVIRLVVRPGLINVGLDDLMSALRTNRSRCLFGSGIASGKDRAMRALRNALSSPLLDQGSLLKQARTVLVHLSGGEDLTLYEIELLMQRLQKFIPEDAHVLFGAAVDPAMADSLSLTLISALPEDALIQAPRGEHIPDFDKEDDSPFHPASGFTAAAPASKPKPEPVIAKEPRKGLFKSKDKAPKPEPEPVAEPLPESKTDISNLPAATLSLFDEDAPFAEARPRKTVLPEKRPTLKAVAVAEFVASPSMEKSEPEEADRPDVLEEVFEDLGPTEDFVQSAPESDAEERGMFTTEWRAEKPIPEEAFSEHEIPEPEAATRLEPEFRSHPEPEEVVEEPEATEHEASEPSANVKLSLENQELTLGSTPRGRFEGGSAADDFDGEDLDLPPFLRKK